MADDLDHQVQQRRRHRSRRLLQALFSPNSYGLVLLLILVTYVLSASTLASPSQATDGQSADRPGS
jgi:hypothetical protein